MALVILWIVGFVLVCAFFAYLVWWLVDRDSRHDDRD